LAAAKNTPIAARESLPARPEIWLAVADAPHRLGLVFIALFISAISFQRFAPAT